MNVESLTYSHNNHDDDDDVTLTAPIRTNCRYTVNVSASNRNVFSLFLKVVNECSWPHLSQSVCKLPAIMSQSSAILPDSERRFQPIRLSAFTSTYHSVACLVGTGNVVLVDQTIDGSIRFVTTPATCPQRYGDEPFSGGHGTGVTQRPSPAMRRWWQLMWQAIPNNKTINRETAVAIPCHHPWHNEITSVGRSQVKAASNGWRWCAVMY